jgi:hypothetical protein
VFRVGDGAFVKHIATGLNGPWDVEEVEGGWLVACFHSDSVEFVCDVVGGDGGGRPRARRASLGRAGGGYGKGDGEFSCPAALTVVSGLGLVVRERGNRRLQVFATPDTIAMAAMSPVRVAWMAARGRGTRCASSSILRGAQWCRHGYGVIRSVQASPARGADHRVGMLPVFHNSQ